MQNRLTLSHLTVGYRHRRLIENVDAGFDGGLLTALIGRNGTGKSSLLRVMAGVAEPLAGSVLIDGADILAMSPAQRARAIALVTTERIRVAHLRCFDLVAMGRAPYSNWIGNLTGADREIVMRSLESVGMGAYADRSLDTMSDGECQRVMIARALAQDTPILLLDEPTSFLDMPNRYELCILLQKIARDQDKCVVFSTHELDIALNLCDRIALIDSPRLMLETPQKMIESGAIPRLFESANIRFDPETHAIKPSR